MRKEQQHACSASSLCSGGAEPIEDTTLRSEGESAEWPDKRNALMLLRLGELKVLCIQGPLVITLSYWDCF